MYWTLPVYFPLCYNLDFASSVHFFFFFLQTSHLLIMFFIFFIFYIYILQGIFSISNMEILLYIFAYEIQNAYI